MFKQAVKSLCMTLSIFLLTSCEDTMLQKTVHSQGEKAPGNNRSGPGDKKANPGETYRFPEIVETEFIPNSSAFDDMKCLTWKITWPVYDSDYDTELIPTVLSLNNSELNSINFLNSTDGQNTYNSTLSLYYGSKVESANTMWNELYYSFGTEESEDMETVYFEKGDYPLTNIIDWVTKRPQLFEIYWPGSSNNDLDYVEGDFIQFHLSQADLYGGIRIVSMSPRIIEVYLAVSNE
jgi:hypothetical protein